ncbi:MAG: tetratricopeptide repeat protein [Nitrospinota bacterium]|nr:MAG: tetratricopeptide repeat protein [Nitrospinota bacterium]
MQAQRHRGTEAQRHRGTDSQIFAVLLALCIGTFLLCPGVLWAGQPSLTEMVERGEAALERWEMAEARQWVKKIEAFTPLPAEAEFFRSRVWFYQGEYDRAVETIGRAVTLDPDNEMYQGYQGFFTNTRLATQGLESVQSEHFTLLIDREKDGILIPYALEALEQAYQVFGKQFGFTPRERVRVEIFPDPERFYHASSLSRRDIEVSGAIGICKFNKIMLLSPRTLLRGYRWLDALTHEYMHYVMVHLTNNKAPIWLHEGVAKYQEYLWRSPRSLYLNPVNETLLANALRENDFVSFAQMDPSLVKLDTTHQVRLAYAEAASAIDFILQRVGYPGLQRILQHIAQAEEQGAQQAIQEELRLDFAAFERQWKAFLRQQNLQEIPGVYLEKYTLKDRVKDEEEWGLQEIRSQVVRNHVRLGDLFRSRGRLVPAVLEYKKALRKSHPSPFLYNKLGKALLLRGRYAEALTYLEKAKTLYPDYVTTYTNLGILFLQQKRLAEAEEAFTEAIQINPFDPQVHQGLYQIYLLRGEREKAAQAEKTVQTLLMR